MEFTTDILSVFDKKWALLTAGDKDKFNTMTVSWGGLGTIWGKPVATVYVRKSRYTHDFMEDNDYFTVSFYPEECRKLFCQELKTENMLPEIASTFYSGDAVHDMYIGEIMEIIR